MNPLLARKQDLLLESDLNRQALVLELLQIRHRVSGLGGGLLRSRWKFVVPLAGLLFVWKFRRLGKFLTSGVGLLLLRKLWEGLVAWSRADATPARRD